MLNSSDLSAPIHAERRPLPAHATRTVAWRWNMPDHGVTEDGYRLRLTTTSAGAILAKVTVPRPDERGDAWFCLRRTRGVVLDDVGEVVRTHRRGGFRRQPAPNARRS